MKKKSMITMLVIALMLVLSLTVLSACGKNKDDNKDDTPATYSVTVTNGTGGGEYAEGATVKIKANAPETGKEFTSWTIEGVTVDDKTKAEITFTMPANAVTATANYGDVQYEFALENCTADKETAKFGEQVTFTADEIIGKRFDSWNIKGVDDLTGLDLTKSPLTFTMPANDINVAAVLEDIDYTVTVTGGTADKTTAHYGDSITITAAAPETGKRFTGWTLEGVTVENTSVTELTFTMPANNVKATANYDFEDYEIKVTGGMAQVNDGGTFSTNAAHYGDNVKIKAHTPGTGMKFKNWTITGVDTSELVLTNEELTFTMPAGNVTATANYDFINYTVSVTGGTANKTTAHYGDTVTITANAPATGKEFTGWTLNGVTVENTSVDELTFTMPANNVKATANYDFIDYDITVTGGKADKTTAHYGEQVTITANAPETGKEFVMWSFEGFAPDGLTLTDAELTFTMPAKDVTATANYDLINYTVTVNGGIAKVNGVETETAHYGDTVTITANEPGTNKEFIGWNSPDGVVFNNNTSIETTFTMPASNVTVNAVFRDINKYSVLVNYGTSGTYDAQTAYCGDPVTITAKNIEGKIFVRWEITGLDTEGLDLTKSPLTFTMPENNVSANAIYEDLITLTFEGSTAQSEPLTYRKGASKTFRIELGDSQELCEYDISLTNKSCTFKVYDSVGNEIEPTDNGDGSMRIAVNRQDIYTIRVTYEGASSSSQCTIKITASSPTV